MNKFVERIDQIELTLEVLLRLIAKSPSSAIANFVQEGLTGRKMDVLSLISKDVNTQDALSKKLDVSGSAVRKYIAECNMAFREFLSMEKSEVELITSPGRGEGWKPTMIGKIILSIKESEQA